MPAVDADLEMIGAYLSGGSATRPTREQHQTKAFVRRLETCDRCRFPYLFTYGVQHWLNGKMRIDELCPWCWKEEQECNAQGKSLDRKCAIAAEQPTADTSTQSTSTAVESATSQDAPAPRLFELDDA